MPYISHSHFTVFPTSNFPLDFVNQKLVVIVGSIIAWKTCETGFLISICVSTVGILFVILCYLLKVQISVFIGLSYNDHQRFRAWRRRRFLKIILVAIHDRFVFNYSFFVTEI